MTTRTVLLKLSGEALGGPGDGILDAAELDRVCADIAAGITASGTRVALVVGGGNIMRGASVAGRTADPTAGDYMGMLATLINALALKDGLRRAGCRSEVVGPHAIPNVAHGYNRDQVMAWLAEGVVVVFGGGTGHPFLTTDTAAAMRGAEIAADEVIKGSNVDGIYEADPRKVPDAKRFDRLSFDEAIAGRYAVMDQTAFAICRDRQLPIRVFDMTLANAIPAVLGNEPPGTVVGP